MGVSVRTSRNTRVSLPFWLAIPWALCMLAGWLIVFLVHGVFVVGGCLWRTVQARSAARR